jgi:4-alpha-glucanotransferase
MRIGLIGDLAVGMDPSGSHAWSRQGDVLGGLSVGAPPDLFNPRGQDWGLTGFSPRALIAGGFAPFIATVRAALRNTGGVRLDHAMGLTRLWLIPQGADPADGAYLTYPLTDLLRLLALESQRHTAIVVGEDLGTVPAGFRDALETAGLHGMRVLWFERNDHAFNSPETWDHTAVAMTSTHDLPTVAGWWHGSDITTRAESGRLGVGVQEAEVSAERTDDRGALWHAISQSGAAVGDAPSPNDTEPVVDAALAFVAATPSPLCLPPIEDLLGIEEQPNLPGTIDQHPNWRRRLAAEAGTLFNDPRTAQRVAQLATRRPRL